MSSHSTFKLILLGNQAVGKTSLLEQYVNNSYSVAYKATLAANFLTKKVRIAEGNYLLQIWDTAGQEAFQSLGHSFYRGSDACVLVFDLTSTKTFESLPHWREEFLFQLGNEQKIPFLVIGNKADLEEKRVVSYQKAHKWCEEMDILYFECSARSGLGVSEAFSELISQVIAYSETYTRAYNPSFSLKSNKKLKKNCKC